jgi:hypothetical protein
MMIFNSIGDRTPVVSASDTQTLDGQRLVEPDISGKPKKRAGRATGPACRHLLIAAMTSLRPSAHGHGWRRPSKPTYVPLPGS